MENINEYIETGILELYVLGDLSPAERLQVEQMALLHPIVKTEIAEIERAMEFYAEEHAIAPNEALKASILNSLVTNLGDDNTFINARKHTEEVFEDDEVHVNNVAAMPARQNSFFKYAFAACLALLLVSIYGLVTLYSKLEDTNTQLTVMQLNNQRIANQVNVMDDELDIYRDPSFKVYKLQGTAKTPSSAMTVAWSPSKRKVLLDLKTLQLPAHDKQHQYQLWALVGGKPVDLGVFDADGGQGSPIVKEMKSIAAADAFAVTLEPTGGSVSPTLDQMVVMGATK